MRDQTNQTLPGAVHETGTNDLPTTLTFFLTRSQRTQVLRALSAIHSDRAIALLKVLGAQGREVRS